MTGSSFDDGFTLALGGGGARGWAHLGVARALEAHGLRPSRIVGTSMGAIVGAGLAAGRTPDEIAEGGRRTPLFRNVRRGRLALFDPQPVLERMAADLGDPRIEDLPLPLGISTFDLVTGRPRLLTSGRLVDALARSIAVPLFFSPCPDTEGVWCDAGPWEGVPVSLARAWAPDAPVIGVLADIPKLGLFASPLSAAVLRAASTRLGVGTAADPLTARRYLALLAARWADPVVDEAPDLLIAPRLGWMSALQYGRIAEAAAIGERDARLALQAALARVADAA
ncbi:MAG TPA: patatin-like phospholipase family protein [Candidatus Limnocylindria bacterium]|nr:patatin-like phospholipase family protein [Candidatus Limnocylindria bacterium]